MKQRIIVIVGALCLFAGLASADPLRTLILTGKHNHDWQSTTPFLKKMLEESGRFVVDVTENPASLDAAALQPYDLLVDNWAAYPEMTGHQWGATAETAILDFVRNGKGIVLLHAATACFADWPEFDQLAGCAWRDEAGHGAVHCLPVTIADKEHPITAGMTDFLSAPDELYHRLRQQPSIHVLCTAFSDPDKKGTGQVEPVAVCTTFGQGRCFYNILGHDVKAMKGIGFQALTLRGAEWAATGQVTLPLPPSFATALDAIRTYDYGQSRAGLIQVEALIHASLDIPGERTAAEDALLGFLDSNATRAAKDFACRQLSLIATEKAIPKMNKLLDQPDIADSARSVLERIPGEKATNALIEALPGKPGGVQIGIINSLAARRASAAIKHLGVLMRSEDQGVAIAAVDALGAIGGDPVVSLLNPVRFENAPSLSEAAGRAMIRCAGGILDAGRADRAAELFEMALQQSIYSRPVREGALQGLAAARPQQSAALIARILKDPASDLDRAAIRAAREITDPAATATLTGILPGLTVERQALLIGALADRGDVAACPAVLASLGVQDDAVQLAALRALGTIGDASAVGPLANAAANTGKPDQATAARESLKRIHGEGIAPAMLGILDTGDVPARVEIIRAMAERHDTEAIPRLLQLAEGTDAALSGESFKALGTLADSGQFKDLAAIMTRATTGEMREQAAQAIVEAARNRAAQASAAELLLATLPNAQDLSLRATLFHAFGELGVDATIEPLTAAATAEPDPGVREAAIRALAGWPTPAAIAPLKTIASQCQDPGQAALLRRGFIRCIGLESTRPAEETLGLYREAMTLAAQPDEKKQILAGLAGIAVPGALDTALECMANPELENEAGLAGLKIAEALLPTAPEAARNALDRIATNAKDPALAGQARALLIKDRLAGLENIAPQGHAESPDNLDCDGGSTGDAAAIDGKPETYWDEVDGQAAYTFKVTFDAPKTIAAISVLGYEHQNYAPKDFEIRIDGQTVATITGAVYADNLFLTEFAARPATNVELYITGTYGASPGIRELGIYAAPGQ